MDNQKVIPDGYVFLDIQRPHVAWAAYRGVLVSCPSTVGFVSFWHASMLQNATSQIASREMELEKVRKQRFPNRTSRLKGLYCFLDLESAKRASLWDGDHFTLNNLAELALKRLKTEIVWTRTGSRAPEAFPSDQWMPRYWEGDPFPDKEPIWETLFRAGQLFLVQTFGNGLMML